MLTKHYFQTLGFLLITISLLFSCKDDPVAIIQPKIDGTITDWKSIPEAMIATSASSGTITKIKVDYDDTHLYFYIEGSDDFGGFLDVHLDSDNNISTGFSNHWYPNGYGADYLIEGDFSNLENSWVGIYKDNEDVDEWSWILQTDSDAGVIASSSLIDLETGVAIEFSVARSAIPNLSDDGFSFAIIDIDGTTNPDEEVSWEWNGVLPLNNLVDSKLYFFEFK